jgi:hypothetical protein
MMLIEGEGEYAGFIRKLNALIDEFNKLRAHKSTKEVND